MKIGLLGGLWKKMLDLNIWYVLEESFTMNSFQNKSEKLIRKIKD